jgi:tetratricopeptide (TPR) repeat protein
MMKQLFSQLLKVGVLLVLIVVAWIIHVNLQQQAGQPVEEQAVEPEQQPVAEVTETDAPPAAEPAAPEEEQAPIPAPESEAAAPTVPAPPPAAEITAEPEIAPAAEPQIPAPSEEEAPPPPQQPAAEIPEPGEPAPAPKTKQADRQPATLEEARQAAWKGQWDKAEAAYRQLQQEQPDNFNIHGELGNLYFMQRKGKEAAGAYYQAATLLAAQGYRRDAIRLMQVVQRLDRELGIKLQQELFGSGGGAPAPYGQGRSPSSSP